MPNSRPKVTYKIKTLSANEDISRPSPERQAPSNIAGRNLMRRITSNDIGVLKYDVLIESEATHAMKRDRISNLFSGEA